MAPILRRALGVGVLAGAGALAGLYALQQSRVLEDVPLETPYPVAVRERQGGGGGRAVVVVPTWTPPSRAQQLERLEGGEVFDVLVVGGGATGSGVGDDCRRILALGCCYCCCCCLCCYCYCCCCCYCCLAVVAVCGCDRGLMAVLAMIAVQQWLCQWI